MKLSYKTLYGYKIDSDLELPYLRDCADGFSSKLITIRKENVPHTLENASFSGKRFQIAPGQIQTNIQGVADFLIKQNQTGFHISYTPDLNSNNYDIAAFLLGLIMAQVLHMDRYLTLHAGSLNIGGQTILIAGNSGAGKSSLLAELLKRGATLITDDVSPVRQTDQSFTIEPGHANIRLWADAARKSGFPFSDKNRIRPADDKYWIPVPEKFSGTSQEITNLFILKNKRSSDVCFQNVNGIKKMEELKAINFRKVFIRLLNREKEFFEQSTKFANTINIHNITRPEGYYANQIAERIINYLKQ
ncbi:MAG: hypothetical protein K9I29_05545 [Bacteroidales bacterium]|nr:hypothetical protein [Bacteroidales bacterium]MCF8327739.1 hypothetical protein [Bacteroidales bacterium]